MEVGDVPDVAAGVSVRVRVLSNWGHASRVGLTELQLVDTAGAALPVDPAHVTLRGAAGSTDVACLFNGRCKVRETYEHLLLFWCDDRLATS